MLADRIQATVKEILGGKGITPASKASAAMWIYWSYSIERTPDAPDHPADSMRTVEESVGHAPAGRVLVIFEMIDPRTEKSLWRGTAESELYPDISSRTQAKRVREAVRNTFKPFPPKDSASSRGPQLLQLSPRLLEVALTGGGVGGIPDGEDLLESRDGFVLLFDVEIGRG